ncbi:MAG: hydrogenase maturation nickel metallochaperone HypA [Planctomycetes bacterium]|nr:hydrogenase maturation nickel metallochaperone HypA [Planctomycetota bacterium]
MAPDHRPLNTEHLASVCGQNRVMHELAIATELVRQLGKLAAQHGAGRVQELTVTAGAMRGIVPEALEMAFSYAAKGTCADGAVLRLETVQPVARCRQCDTRYNPTGDSFLCPSCGQANAELVAGNDIVLASVTLEDGSPE